MLRLHDRALKDVTICTVCEMHIHTVYVAYDVVQGVIPTMCVMLTGFKAYGIKKKKLVENPVLMSWIWL